LIEQPGIQFIVALSAITLFDGSLSAAFDGLPGSASGIV
jgi:hypothetical protein